MISIIIPTYNERESLQNLLPALLKATDEAGLDVEVVIADDLSPDGTADEAEILLKGRKSVVLRREGPRGLAPAVVEGFEKSNGEILGVMDADMSHPVEAVPRLVKAVEDGAELAVGSRYVPGGGMEGWPFKRRFVSRVACLMALPLTRVKDATSGFFFCRREVLDGVHLHPKGFKIGLEVFVRGRYQSRTEVPFVFTDRAYGSSKLGGSVMLDYILQLVRLGLWRVIHPFGG